MAKDRKIDMVILGLLSHEDLSGYDIKKRIDNGISFFWKGSFGSIYPSLNAMEQDGFVQKKEMSTTGRAKIVYSITEKGREVLLDWLKDSHAVNDLKYETLLKVFFGGAANSEITLNTILEFEEEIKISLQILQGYKENLSKVLDQKDHINYYLTVSFGVETYEAYLRWCEGAKELLKS